MLAPMSARADELMDFDPDVLESWYDEAERRWGEIERGEVETLSWDEVRERVFGAR